LRPSRWLEEGLRVKRRVLEDFGDGKDRVQRDHHSKRRPIPCGMTIHPAIGCSYGCAYCYIYDMGFPPKPEAYPLSPEEMLTALALNPYFLPGRQGTLVAFGSVTEPFMNPSIASRTLEYMRIIGRFFGNPQQVSTKAAPGLSVARNLAGMEGGPPSVLISVTSLDHSRKLEPGAPSVEDRLEWGSLLLKLGVPVTLFLRPLIPGISSEELKALLYKAWEKGFRRVILGSLRVTPGIIRRLSATGMDMGEIKRRMPREPRGSRDQVVLRMRDLKEKAGEMARELGYQVLPASCSANIVDHGLSCWACNMGPCGPVGELPLVSEDEVKEALEILGLKGRLRRLEVKGGLVRARVSPASRRVRKDVVETLLSTVFKRRLILDS